MRLTPEIKTCPNCRLGLPAKAFYQCRSTRDGLSSHCRECSKQRARQYGMDHPEEKRAAYRSWYLGKGREWHAAWRNRNREKVRELSRAGQRKRHRVHLACNDRYQATRRGAPCAETIDRMIVYHRDGGRCHICRKKLRSDHFHLDHLIPLSTGGDHLYRNIAVACPSCNCRRGAGRLQAQLRLF